MAVTIHSIFYSKHSGTYFKLCSFPHIFNINRPLNFGQFITVGSRICTLNSIFSYLMQSPPILFTCEGSTVTFFCDFTWEETINTFSSYILHTVIFNSDFHISALYVQWFSFRWNLALRLWYLHDNHTIRSTSSGLYKGLGNHFLVCKAGKYDATTLVH